MKSFAACAIVIMAAALPYAAAQTPVRQQANLGATSATLISVDGFTFKDLDHNGKLDVYEDWRRSPEERARDLVGLMTIEEKAGALMHGTPPSVGDIRSDWDLAKLGDVIGGKHINYFISRLARAPRVMAQTNNDVQALGEKTRLGIPVTFSSDPRNHFQYTAGASVAAGSFSQWPETTGLAAIGDADLVRRFGDVARQEYLAAGLRMALSPMADLATEPRWPRISGTFGEDPQLAKKLVEAYVEGFQGGRSGVTRNSVASVVKHWVGYGAEQDGFDAHNVYGKTLAYPGNNFAAHVGPFTGAFDVHVAGVMPTYGLPDKLTINGKPAERVGAGFSKQMLTDLLRGTYSFNGMILTDWQITDDCKEKCVAGTKDLTAMGMPWGVEKLTQRERFAKALDAGVDQFGGVENAEIIVDLVAKGRIKKERIDQSVYRVLLPKFQEGLFENPYVDVDAAASIIGAPAFQAEALNAQRRSLVLLENKQKILPLAQTTGKRVLLRGVSAEVAARYGFTVVTDPAQADLAIVRISAPFERLHPNFFFGSIQHEGDLSFADGNPDYQFLKSLPANLPRVVTVYLDRPAVLTNVRDLTTALIGNFGVSDVALLDVIAGRAQPEGKLPFELPSSMDEVRRQKADVPHDTAKPLYPIAYGLRY